MKKKYTQKELNEFGIKMALEVFELLLNPWTQDKDRLPTILGARYRLKRIIKGENPSEPHCDWKHELKEAEKGWPEICKFYRLTQKDIDNAP